MFVISSILGAMVTWLTVILTLAESVPLMFVAVTVYIIAVAVALGVPEIVPVAVLKDKPLVIAGDIE